LAGQGGGCDQLGAGRLDALLNFRFAVIGHQKPQERADPQTMNSGLPAQFRSQMGPIVAEIAGEERRNEE